MRSFFIVAVATMLVAVVSPAFAKPAVTSADAGFSAGPGDDYGPELKIKVGTHVDVIWCGTHKNWCLVDIHNKRGWIPMASLNFKLPPVTTLNNDGTPNTSSDTPTGPASGPGNDDGNNKSMAIKTPPTGPKKPVFTVAGPQVTKVP